MIASPQRQYMTPEADLEWEAIDRGKKFRRYRQAESLREYLRIQADQKGVECFRKNEAGLWVLHSDEAEDELVLETVDLSLPIEALYRQVQFEPNFSVEER